MRAEESDGTFREEMALLDPRDFYEQSMAVLDAAGIPFLVGGAFALRVHAGIVRDTKDFDLMLRREDLDTALRAFKDAGFQARVVFPHWIAKVHHGERFIDIIYNSGNGRCPVDDEWFAHARSGRVLGRPARLCPPEEMIWQKAFIMERERFDGADVAHLLRCCSAEIDWPRLIARFGADGSVLLAHLLLTRFIYPSEPAMIPDWVFAALHAPPPAPAARVCNGPLLSRSQYLADIESWRYDDARITRGLMSESEVGIWTAAIDAPAPAVG